MARSNAAKSLPARPQTGAQQEAAPTRTAQLDRLIHEHTRLGIISALAAAEHLTFNELKSLLGASDGNISVHTRKLEEAGYINCKKGFEGRVPRTEYSLTAEGRAALDKYLDHMDAIIGAVRSSK